MTARPRPATIVPLTPRETLAGAIELCRPGYAAKKAPPARSLPLADRGGDPVGGTYSGDSSYPRAKARGARRFGLQRMLPVHRPAMLWAVGRRHRSALYDSLSIRRFMGVNLGAKARRCHHPGQAPAPRWKNKLTERHLAMRSRRTWRTSGMLLREAPCREGLPRDAAVTGIRPQALPHGWSKDALLAKAQRYSELMLAYPHDDWRFAFWSTLLLELLARAALSHISPVLLADPKDWNNAYHALGFSPKASKFAPEVDKT